MEKTIQVKVRAGAKQRQLKVDDAGVINIWTTKAPEKGRANDDVVDMLAEHFRVAKSCVQLVRGQTSSKKTFKITA
jgi:uncharacterized protein YggU (UPF0235/DUF167 family)